MSKYWDKRVKQWVKSQDISDRELSDRLVKYYKHTSDELQDDIARYYAKYGTDNVLEYKELLTDIRDEPDELKRLIERTDEFMNMYPEYAHLTEVRNSIYKLNRLESLNYSTQLRLMELGAIEQREIEAHLKQSYGAMYKQVAKELGLGDAFLSTNAQVVQHTIFDKWVDGKNFSDRVWDNKEKLMNQLQTRIRDGFVRGDNFESLTKVMTERLGVGYNDARRLIWTESSYIMNQASAQPYIDSGQVEYRINAILDNKTSQICRSLHDEVFSFEDRKVGINFPPFHPYCRTMIVGVNTPRTVEDIN